jgi:hypothetical protein
MQMPNDVLNSLSAPTGKTELSQNDVLAALGDEGEESTDTQTAEEIILEDKSDKTPDADKDDEKEENESEETEKLEVSDDDDEKIELKDEEVDEYVELPSRKSILKAYPDLFKKFPGVERAMYREKEYTETFPTIAEAKQAKERLEVFRNIETDLFDGNITNLLSSVKKQDDKAFGKITGTLLQTLEKVDKDAYYGTVNHVIQHALSAAHAKGKAMGDDDGEQLQIAARLINKWIYGSAEIQSPQPLANAREEKEDPKESELTKREQEFNQRQLNTAINDVSSRTRSTVEGAVNKYLDPKGQMTDYVRNKAVSDVMSQLDKEIGSDQRFKNHVDILWKDAAKNGYSDESKSRIRKAIIAKAQTILPDVIRKVRADALKGLGGSPRRKTVEKEEPESNTRRQAPPSRSSQQDKPKPRASSVSDVMRFLNE